MSYLFKALKEDSNYQQMIEALSYSRAVRVTGPLESQKAHFCHAVAEHLKRPYVYIAYNELNAGKILNDFNYFCKDNVKMFPHRQPVVYNIKSQSRNAQFERISVLDSILNNKRLAIITSIEAVLLKTIPADLLKEKIINIKINDLIEINDLAMKLIEAGYERVEFVEEKGQFAVRGGILDIYTPLDEYGIRIEFFDNEIDTMRKFDIQTQRTIGEITKAHFIPAGEIILEENKRNIITEKIKNYKNENNRTKDKNIYKKLCESIETDIEKIEENTFMASMDKYYDFIYEKPGCFFDYIDEDYLVFIDCPSRCRARSETLLFEYETLITKLIEAGHFIPNESIYYDYSKISRYLNKYTNINIDIINRENENDSFCINSFIPPALSKNTSLIIKQIKEWKDKKYSILVLCQGKEMQKHIIETLLANGIEAVPLEDGLNDIKPGITGIAQGNIHTGFCYPDAKIALIAPPLYKNRKSRRRKNKKYKKDDVSIFTDLKINDYVVHDVHGIGRYIGIEQLKVDKIKKDYMKIAYKDNDNLYIPVNQLDSIQKYIGSEGRAPKLSRLGGNEWTKTKAKVKASLKDIAQKLIELYAKRNAVKGFAFSKDTIWQKQFEEGFPYEETDDQIQCIKEVKDDMESDRVMDRLLCGDVGYGKTEVAIRAVFKAVMDGKQAAYLCPTTVLAQQQYEGFKERMKDFAVNVDVLSRFRSRAEQKKIVNDVKAGRIDVLIGTHRLIQKDISFNNLGLLIIDEEQRFGVEHKEKIKNDINNVDVLTLTATPIPRTLHMSLAGIRDISILEDPPEERFPVQTYVMEYDHDVIKDAIEREIARNGQVFYLYNIVKGIDNKLLMLRDILPLDIKIAAAHGQMDERKLEHIMNKFLEGDIDVLLCTTIIESGLDMPNVNTIIVENADRMGLAQLYQLRGRVGRASRQAFAYITYKKNKILSEMAEKRLSAINEFTDFGSGFKIAMRDMEIRGAGNLLGAQQHGHMTSVGYDMYCRLLDQAVKELKGEEIKPQIQTAVDLDVSAYIQKEYIKDEEQRLELYRKIASTQSTEDITDITDELIDRFGTVSDEIMNLINISYIRHMAAECKILNVLRKNDKIFFEFSPEINIDIEALSKIIGRYKNRLMFSAGKKPVLIYKDSFYSEKKIIENVKNLLTELKSFEN